MSYEERLKRYEAEKQKLIELGISPLAHERAVIELARKWREYEPVGKTCGGRTGNDGI